MKKLSLFAAVALTVAVSGSAYAAATLIVSDGVTTSGPLTTSTGILSYSNPSFDSAWNIAITFAETKPAVGSPGNPTMDVQIAATSFGLSPARNLTIIWSDNGFGPVSGSLNAQLTGHSVAGGGQGVTYDTWLDAGNVIGAQTTHITSSGLLSDPYSSLQTAALSQSLFSLTQVLVINGTPAGAAGSTYSIEGTLALVPEPASLSLIGLGAALLFFRRNRA
jgi:hypothetical protein